MKVAKSKVMWFPRPPPEYIPWYKPYWMPEIGKEIWVDTEDKKEGTENSTALQAIFYEKDNILYFFAVSQNASQWLKVNIAPSTHSSVCTHDDMDVNYSNSHSDITYLYLVSTCHVHTEPVHAK